MVVLAPRNVRTKHFSLLRVNKITDTIAPHLWGVARGGNGDLESPSAF
jgi:hypothetical protein